MSIIDTQGNVTPHINTGEPRDVNRARRILESPDVRVAYLMGEGHDWIDHALQHCELVCVRIFDMFNDGGHATDADATLYTRHSVEETFERVASRNSKYRHNPRVRWILLNEPSTNESSQFNRKYMLDWLAKAGRYFAERGYGTGLGGLAMSKTNGLPFHNGSDWDNLLMTLAAFPEWCHLDIHEYAFLMQAAGHLKTYHEPFPDMYLNRLSMHPDNWGDIDYETGNTDDNWHLGNIAALSKYNREVLKLPQFWYGRGECGFDYVVEQWWKDWVDLVYMPRYGGIKPEGTLNLKAYWADVLHGIPFNQVHLYTGEMFNQDLIRNAAYLKRNSGKGCLYNSWFAWNTNPYWTDDDISRPECERYIQWMETEQHTVLPLHVTPPPLDEEKPFMFPVTISGQNQTNQTPVKVNVRKDRSTQSQIVGVIPAYPETVTGYAAAPDTTAMNGYIWRYVEVTIANTNVSGYVAENFVKVTELPDTPLFYDLSLPGQPTVRMTAEEWHKYVEVQYAFATYLSAIVGSEQ